MEKMEDIHLPWPDWKIVRYIGGGSYGKVYEIERNVAGILEKAAVKIIARPRDESEIEEYYDNGYSQDTAGLSFDDELKNYVKEYQFMKELQGQTHIVSCDDFALVRNEDGIGGKIYLRMELLTSLKQIIRERSLSENEIIKLGKDISHALMLCERKQIIHRDIKPQNILLSPFGDYKLGDFGVSKVMDHTTFATAMGTPEYQAPEVVHMEKYGQTADIYSLGITLYWLLNNRKMPFISADATLTPMVKVQAAERRYHGEKLPAPKDGSTALKLIVLKACAYRPEDRYASAKELHEALEALKNEENILGKTTETDTKTAPPEWEESDSWGNSAGTIGVVGKQEKVQDFHKKEPVEEEKTVGAKQVYQKQEKQQKPEDIEFHWETEEEKELQEKELQEKELQKKEKNWVWKSVMIGTPIIFFVGILAFIIIDMRDEKIQRNQQKMMDSAKTFLENGDYEGAEKVYKKYAETYPREEEGYLGLGYLYYETGNYEKAMEIAEEGMVYHCEMEDLYDQAACRLKLTEARSAVEAGDYEGASNACESAADSYDSSWDTPIWWYRNENWIEDVSNDIACELTDLYLQMQDTGNARWWLTEVQDDTKKEELTSRLQEKENELLAQQQAEHKAKFVPKLTEVYQMMEAGDYSGLLNFFLTEREAMEVPDNALLGGEADSANIYFQNGDMVGKIESGVGMILSRWGVYVGEITNNQRSGAGKQFGIWNNSAEDKTYAVTTGQWQNNKANGECTYEVRYLENSLEDDVYKGNVVDNLFHGDIIVTWWYDNGKQGSAVGHAENGTWNLIRQEGNNFIIAENSSGGWFAYQSQEALVNKGVWSFY